MKLSTIHSSDHRLWAAVVLGDVEDDGQPIEDETLAIALEAWRMTQDIPKCAAVLSVARPDEPWSMWLSASMLGWVEIRPRMLRLRGLWTAHVLAEVTAEKAAHARRVLAEATDRATAANDDTERLAELVRRCVRG